MSDTQWYVAQCRVARAFSVRSDIHALGFDCLVPSVLRRNEKKEWEQPLFSRYAFIELELTPQNMDKIRGVRDFRGFMVSKQTGNPIPLDDLDVFDLLATYGAGPIEEAKYTATAYRVGQKYIVREGPWRGSVGPCIRASAQQLVLLVRAFGGMVRAAVPPGVVEAI